MSQKTIRRRLKDFSEYWRHRRNLKKPNGFGTSSSAYYFSKRFAEKGKWQRVEGLLKHKNDEVKTGAARATMDYHLSRDNLDEAKKLLTHAEPLVRMEAAEKMTKLYLNSGNVPELEQLYQRGSDEIRTGVAREIFSQGGYSKEMFVRFIPFLNKIIEGEDPTRYPERRLVALKLLDYYLSDGSWQDVDRLINHPDRSIRLKLLEYISIDTDPGSYYVPGTYFHLHDKAIPGLMRASIRDKNDVVIPQHTSSALGFAAKAIIYADMGLDRLRGIQTILIEYLNSAIHEGNFSAINVSMDFLKLVQYKIEKITGEKDQTLELFLNGLKEKPN
jgi:hypothetical protein